MRARARLLVSITTIEYFPSNMRLVDNAALLGALLLAPRGDTKQCYRLPSDPEWPSTKTWSTLNSTVNGKLVATVPIGSPCHDPTYDADACDALKAQWTNPLTQ
jgi:hypothetical protein